MADHGWSTTRHSPWAQAPRTMTTFGLLPDTSVAHWEAGFTAEAWRTQPPVESVKVSQLNHVAPLPPEFMSRPTAAPTGIKAICPLIKFQSYDGFRCLETFMMKFY